MTPDPLLGSSAWGNLARRLAGADESMLWTSGAGAVELAKQAVETGKTIDELIEEGAAEKLEA